MFHYFSEVHQEKRAIAALQAQIVGLSCTPGADISEC
jgi:hypothetical protein